MSDKTTFRELIEQIAGKTENSQNFTQDFVRELVRVIESGLKENGSVSISGFGKFELRWMKEREGTNPQSGEKIVIPAQSKVVFKPFKALKEDVNRPYAKMEARILDALTDGSVDDDETEQNTPPVIPVPADLPKKEIVDEPKEEPESDPDDPFGVDESLKSSSSTPPNDLTRKSPPEEKSMIEDPFSIVDDNSSDDPFDVAPVENIIDSDDPFSENFPVNEHIDDEVDELFDTFSETEESDLIEQEQEEPVEKSEQEKATETPVITDLSESEAEDDISVENEFEDSDYDVNVLVVERPAPVPESEEEIYAVTEPEPDETKIVEKVQEESSLNWSYIAAGSLIMLAAVGIYSIRFFWSDSDTPVVDDPGTPPQLNIASDDAVITAPVVTSPYLVEITIEAGQSLWQIAESAYGNGYLWPWIYYENTDKISNPNLIIEGSSLSIPIPVDADNLSLSELEKVGFGYLSVYQWVRENNPEQARFFLWAAGSFSPDVLDMASGNVDESDLAFARRR